MSTPTSAAGKKIILLRPRGFCAGVVRAIDVVKIALDLYGAPIYVRKEIVHNRHVVDELRAGAIFVEELDEVPTGARVIFSAHGVSPAVRADATQPQGDRCDVPAGDQGPPRGCEVRQEGLYDRAHRAQGSRRGDRHAGRGAGIDDPGFERWRTWTALEVADPEQDVVHHADHTQPR